LSRPAVGSLTGSPPPSTIDQTGAIQFRGSQADRHPGCQESSPSRHLKKHRSRRLRQGRSPGCEPLESRRLLAVDVAAPIADQAFANEVAAPLSIPLAEAFRDTAVTGTVVRFDTITPTGSQSFFAELFDTVRAACGPRPRR